MVVFLMIDPKTWMAKTKSANFSQMVAILQTMCALGWNAPELCPGVR